MRKLSIEVQEESGRLGGGHAVIRLMGLQSLPDNVTYRIRPVDTALHSEGQPAWVESDRQPLATRITTEGAELVVGPEIVENPAFMPGTLAVIEVAKCGVRGEFLWPRIAPLVRPKRRHLITVKPARSTLPEPLSDIVFGEATDASSHIEPLAPLPTLEPETAPIADARTDASDAALFRMAEEPLTPAAAVVSGDVAAPPPTEVPAQDASRANDTAVVANSAPVSPSPTAATPMRPAARTWGRGQIAASLAGLVVVALGLNAMSGNPNTPTAKGDAPAATLATLLSGGKSSVPEADASGAALAKLLEDADLRLHGPASGRNKTEAAALLRRYLATTLADERTMWALTQLGSVYAEPAGANQPDYANARRLWELSGSLGDPVAMCFVAALHEHGLGVTADKATALGWYQQSKKAGGCRNIDAAIQRLQPTK